MAGEAKRLSHGRNIDRGGFVRRLRRLDVAAALIAAYIASVVA